MKKSIASFVVCCLVMLLATAALAAERKAVHPGGTKGAGPYSPAVMVGDLIYTSGQLGMDSSGKLADGLEAQTRQAMDNVKKVVEAAGSDMTKLVKVTIFMTDIKDYDTVNKIYSGYFGSEFPARTALQVANLPLGGLIEIEAIAVK